MFAKLDFVFSNLRKECDVIVENDEDAHAHEPRECERSRMLDVRHATLRAGHKRGLLIFRYNPDRFRVGPSPQKILIRDRDQILLMHMKNQDAPPAGGLAIVYLFYDVDIRGNLLCLEDADEEFKALVRPAVFHRK